MKKLPIKVRKIDGGMFPDQLPEVIPPGGWSLSKNVRFGNNKISVILGEENVFEPLDGSPQETHLGIKNNGNITYSGTENEIYYSTGAGWTAMTYGGGSPNIPTLATSNYWDFDILNGVVILNNGIDRPMCILPDEPHTLEYLGGWNVSDASWDGENTSAAIIRGFKGYLIALNLIIQANHFPLRIAWSHPNTPRTSDGDWRNLPTNRAGMLESDTTPGNIVDGYWFGDSFYIFKTDSIDSMWLVNTNDIFNKKTLFTDDGIICKGAWTAFSGGIFCIGKDNLYVINGSNKKVVGEGVCKEFFYKKLNQENYSLIHCVTNERYNEIWISFPNKPSATACNEVLIWNYKHDKWYTRDTPPSRCSTTTITGLQTEGDTWDSLNVTWDSMKTPWQALDSIEPVVLIGGDDVYQIDRGATINGNPIYASLSKPALDFDEYLEASNIPWKNLHEVRPLIVGDGNLEIHCGVQQTQGGKPTNKTVKQFDIKNDKKKTFRLTGRYIDFRLESIGAYWEMSGIDFVISEGHRRS